MLQHLFLPLLLLAGPSLLAQPRISIGINIGAPYAYAPPPPMYVAYRPPCPGPNYVWVDGYWYSNGPRRAWRDGYWAAPRYYPEQWRGGGPKAYGRHDNGRRGKGRGR